MALVLSALAHAVLFGVVQFESGAPFSPPPSQLIEARLVAPMPDAPRVQTPPAVLPRTTTPPAPSPAAPAAPSVPARERAATPVPASPSPAPPRPVRAADTDSAPSAPPSPARAPEPTLPPAPEYRLSGVLSPPPRVLDAPEPVYPPGAENEEGTVVLRILVGASGSVDDVAVVRAMPPGLFDASALEVFRAAKFSPGFLLGQPVKSQMTLELKYTPVNRGSAVSGSGAGLRGPAASRPSP